MIDLEPLRGDITEDTLIALAKTIATRMNDLSNSALTEEESEEIVRSLALVHGAAEHFAVLLLDLCTRSAPDTVSPLPAIVKAARSLKEDPEVSAYLNFLKESLLAQEGAGRTLESFYGDEFHALDAKVVAALDGLDVRPHDPVVPK